MEKSEFKRIYLKKNETAASIIQKLFNAREPKVTVVVPRDSVLGENGNNFYLIFREASAMGKQVNIESSDDEIVDLALASGFQVINPVFKKAKRAVADIIPLSSPKRPQIFRGPKQRISDEGEKISVEEAFPSVRKETSEEDTALSPVVHDYDPEPKIAPTAKTAKFKKLAVLTVLFFLTAGFGVYEAITMLPKADVRLLLSRTDWEIPITLTASVKSDKGSGLVIPGQTFIIDKNNVFSYPASGTEKVERNATGKITIYNAYSSSNQAIVKGTRFITTGGKIFRTVKALIIPGAKISEGKIIPSSIGADVTAESPGAEYNLAGGQTWRIPGFEGTPKFNGFYGESKEAMAGGFVGDVKVPTASDIAALKDKAHQELLASVRAAVLIAVPKELKTVDGVASYNVTKEEVLDDVDEKGEFKLVLAAETKIMAFDEASLRQAVESRLEVDTPGMGFKLQDYEIEYGKASVDFGTGKAAIPLTVHSEWTQEFDIQTFKDAVAGKSAEDFNSYVIKTSEIRSATIDLWPFWVREVPENKNRVKVDLE